MLWSRLFFYKPKTAYEIRISDWSSDVCSSDLALSKLMDIQVSTGADGSVRVSTTNGIALVDITAHKLEYHAPGDVTSGTLFEPITVHSVDPNTGAVSALGTTLDSGVASGALRGLLDMRATGLPYFGRELGHGRAWG